MPDLQSELQAKLSSISFDDAGQTQQQAPSHNVTKQLFDYIATHPNVTGKSLRNIFGNRGVPDGISTRLKQLFNRGLVNRVRKNKNYVYTVAVDQYPPRGSAKRMRRLNAVSKQRIATTPLVVREPAVVVPTDVKHIMNSISIATARALYEELRQTFGK